MRRAPARVNPARSATSDKVIAACPGPKAQMTDKPRASDCT
jgi:hypothetical protein